LPLTTEALASGGIGPRPIPLYALVINWTETISLISGSKFVNLALFIFVPNSNLWFFFARTPPHSVAQLCHRPPQPPLCSDESCHCSVRLCCGVVAICQRCRKVGSFQRVGVRGREEWGPMQFRGCCRNGLLWLLRGRFEGAAVEELWFVPAPHSCFGFSCWLQMTRILLFVVQRWFMHDLNRSCVEDGGSAMIFRN